MRTGPARAGHAPMPPARRRRRSGGGCAAAGVPARAEKSPSVAWCVVAAALISAAANADLREALDACQAIAADAERLACYDAVVAPGHAQAAPDSAPAPAPVAHRPAQRNDGAASRRADADAAFGAEALPAGQERPGAPRTERLAATITRVQALPRGNFRLTLGNGQVWQELRSERGTRYAVGDEVEIRRGMFGAYILSSAAMAGRAKVRRVR